MSANIASSLAILAAKTSLRCLDSLFYLFQMTKVLRILPAPGNPSLPSEPQSKDRRLRSRRQRPHRPHPTKVKRFVGANFFPAARFSSRHSRHFPDRHLRVLIIRVASQKSSHFHPFFSLSRHSYLGSLLRTGVFWQGLTRRDETPKKASTK